MYNKTSKVINEKCEMATWYMNSVEFATYFSYSIVLFVKAGNYEVPKLLIFFFFYYLDF